MGHSSVPMEETNLLLNMLEVLLLILRLALQGLAKRQVLSEKCADDQMGRFSIRYLQKNKINTDGIAVDKTGAVTGLSFYGN